MLPGTMGHVSSCRRIRIQAADVDEVLISLLLFISKAG